MFNWLIAGTDAHAKNYSMLIGARGHVRLAPLYDIASVLAYERINLHAVKLAMRVGGHYRLRIIQARHWRETARTLRLPEEAFMTRLGQMAAALPDAISDTARAIAKQGLEHPNMTRLQKGLRGHVVKCAEVLIAGEGR
jgi:serine/threonine-protein kinase HipA